MISARITWVLGTKGWIQPQFCSTACRVLTATYIQPHQPKSLSDLIRKLCQCSIQQNCQFIACTFPKQAFFGVPSIELQEVTKTVNGYSEWHKVIWLCSPVMCFLSQHLSPRFRCSEKCEKHSPLFAENLLIILTYYREGGPIYPIFLSVNTLKV